MIHPDSIYTIIIISHIIVILQGLIRRDFLKVLQQISVHRDGCYS